MTSNKKDEGWSVNYYDFDAPDIRAFYDTKVLRFWHLEGKDKTFRIVKIQRGEMSYGGEEKMRAILWLETPKGKKIDLPLELNPTNRESIVGIYGVAPRDWIGQLITLYESETRTPKARGMVPCIRVRPWNPADRQKLARRQLESDVIGPGMTGGRDDSFDEAALGATNGRAVQETTGYTVTHNEIDLEDSHASAE